MNSLSTALGGRYFMIMSDHMNNCLTLKTLCLCVGVDAGTICASKKNTLFFALRLACISFVNYLCSGGKKPPATYRLPPVNNL